MTFIERFIEENGFPPTMRQISEAIGIVVSATHRQVYILIEKGFLRAPHQGRHRAITVARSVKEDR
jgi:SOS-response transcriptional repressor LexA